MRPLTVAVSLAASVPNLQLLADGVTYAAPSTLSFVVGTRHTIEALTTQVSDGIDYVFERWTKGRRPTLSFAAKKPVTLSAAYSLARD